MIQRRRSIWSALAMSVIQISKICPPAYDQAMDSPDPWTDVFAFLENARWMVDESRTRIDGLHQRASYIMAFTGVILAILPTVIDPVTNTKGWFLRDICWALLIGVVTLLAASAFYSARVMFVHPVMEVPAKELQSQFVNWTNKVDKKPETAQIVANYANAIFGSGTVEKDSPLLSLIADAHKRALLLRSSMWLALAGLAALALMLLGLIGGRIS